MKGWVYVISNKAMPGLIKVGYSSKDPELRAKELNNTGSPYSYIVEYDMLIDEPFQIEQRVHKLLAAKRKGKEWFECSAEEAVDAIQKIADGSFISQTFKKADTERVDALRRQREEEGATRCEQDIKKRQIEEQAQNKELQILEKYEQLEKEYHRWPRLFLKYWIGSGCVSFIGIAIFFQEIGLYETVGGVLINSLIMSAFIGALVGAGFYSSSKEGRNRSIELDALHTRRDEELDSIRPKVI